MALTAICVTAIGLVAAAQTPMCTTALITPAAAIRVGPGAQVFTHDIDGNGQSYQCLWAPITSDAAWLTTGFVYFAPGAPGFFGHVVADIAENTTGATRTGHFTLAKGMGTITIVQDPAACIVAPTTVPVGRAGGTISVQIETARPDCGWAITMPSDSRSWISLEQPRFGFSGWRQSVGTAAWVFSVSSNENGTGPRTAIANVGGVAVTIQQEAPLCVFSMSATSATFPAGGGSGTVMLSGSGSDCSYVAATSAGVMITSGANGVAPSTIAYTVSGTLADFQSTPSITVRNATLQITQDAPSIATDAAPTFAFAPGAPGGVSFGLFRSSAGTAPASAPSRITITNTSTPASGWTATVDQPWVKLSASSGATPGALTVSIDPNQAASVPLGTASAVVSIASPIASEGTRRVPIWLSIVDPSSAAAPRGAFDTPNTQLPQSGAIAVTGWAVDDVGIQRVAVSRAAVSGEPAGSEIYIGDATRVHGARPDAAATRLNRIGPNGQSLFLLHPEASRAGWGYMLLSNVLPGGGNGQFTLMADAYDLDGHRTRLGTRTVTFNNAVATKPFGTIDSPAQGETVSGTILNGGWVLSPQPKTIPLDGSTIKVYIDGALLGPVSTYNASRPDVKAFFPELANSDGPGARLSIDTRLLADGVHTIAWGVIDDGGVAEGIGSRYFTVRNGLSSVVSAPAGAEARSAEPVNRLPLLKTDVWSREGVDETGWAMRVATDAAGKRTLYASRGQRIELFLDPTLRAACGTYTGHLMTGEVAGPLPAGASLEAQRGIFRWQPTAAVSGAFEFVFVQHGCDGRERRIPLTVAIGGGR